MKPAESPAETLDPRQIMDRLRILDVNANRALEGLRVVEEYARFSLNDPHHTARLKQCRHDLASALREIPDWQRWTARDTAGDVGTSVGTPSEYERASLEAIVAANLGRVAEALRSIEEFSKGYQPALARVAERLRYTSYDLAKSLIRGSQLAQTFQSAQLYVLVDGESHATALESKARPLVDLGVPFLQLRDKQLTDRDLVERARVLRRLTTGSNTRLIINDRPDIAAIVDADGVHVGQEELTVRDVRRIVGPDRLVGVSTHTIEQARQAVADGADYLGCGPTFPSGTKSFDSFPGLAFLQQVADEIRLPSFAIGGITHEQLDEVLAAGMTRIAVSGAVWRAVDPAAAARLFLTRLAAK